MNALVVKNLRKTFGSVIAVNDISFSIKKGETFGLLGANGAGKTTTINMLTGLLKADSGSVTILGKNPGHNWEDVKNNINVSTAYYPLTDILTIRQNLRVFAKIYDISNREEKIDYLLKRFELDHLQHKKVITLSSGEKTRTALCKGLLNDPKVLFLDECTVGLDPDIAQKTRSFIRDYQKESGCTILFTSHYMHEVEELCDRIAFMDRGSILKIATATQFKKMITKHSVDLTIRNNTEKFVKFLKKEGITLLSQNKNAFTIETSYKEDQIYKTLNKIFSAGFKLSDLHINKPTLDDIFIKYARKK